MTLASESQDQPISHTDEVIQIQGRIRRILNQIKEIDDQAQRGVAED